MGNRKNDDWMMMMTNDEENDDWMMKMNDEDDWMMKTNDDWMMEWVMGVVRTIGKMR